MTNEVIQVKILESGKDWVDYLLLFADILIAPLVATIFGYLILRLTKTLEYSQWRNQKLIEKRIALWDEIGPVLNDIYCYCSRVGSWKDFRPQDVINKKREADKLAYLGTPYFSHAFFECYHQFIESCFETYQGHGKDAKLKSDSQKHKNVHPEWEEQWNHHFVTTSFDENEISKSYAALISRVRSELNPSK